jgi:hypothetical protein
MKNHPISTCLDFEFDLYPAEMADVVVKIFLVR